MTRYGYRVSDWGINADIEVFEIPDDEDGLALDIDEEVFLGFDACRSELLARLGFTVERLEKVAARVADISHEELIKDYEQRRWKPLETIRGFLRSSRMPLREEEFDPFAEDDDLNSDQTGSAGFDSEKE